MSEVVPFRPASPQGGRDDTLWAVIAEAGRISRVAEIFAARDAALADRAWREQQVRAYSHFLRSLREPVPRYSVAPIRRADLPRAWTPLPALGFLRGQFI
ncbi:hypothetical protein NFI95_06370 [Acetobacteraceae bacterium KSS8]|uniref:Uncharacterized protein n=1 Tax=Endosaccharibacter trunci TaxID=2812733 RepID=A0ABT1W6N2_9PROT|nr:hypothetical protein [Acetobacteraceae bacterium KSS8]